MSWVEVGCVSGLRPLVVGLWWLGCWGGGHWRGWGGFWLRFCGGFRFGLLGWWVLAAVCVVSFFFYLFWWLGVKVGWWWWLWL